MQSLQSPAHNTVDGVHYGVPYMWGPNFLMYNTDVVTTAPDQLGRRSFEPTLDGAPNPYAGKVTAYNGPIYIADAAMYLMAHQPDLGITDPYELTQDQLDGGDRPAEAAEAHGQEVLGLLHATRSTGSTPATWSSAPRGR